MNRFSSGKPSPARRSYLIVHEEDEGGGVKPTIHFKENTLSGIIYEYLHGCPLMIENTEFAKDKEGKPTAATFKIIHYKTQEVLLDGDRCETKMLAPGKYTFTVEKELMPGSPPKMLASISFVDQDALEKQRKERMLASRGIPDVWKELAVVETKDGKPQAAIVFPDESAIDVTGRIIETYFQGGEQKKASRYCLASKWDGRGLLGVWHLTSYKTREGASRARTPAVLESRLRYLEGLPDIGDEFPLFSDFPQLLTVQKLKKDLFRISPSDVPAMSPEPAKELEQESDEP